MSAEQTESFGDVIREIQGDLSPRQFAQLAANVPPTQVNDWLRDRVPRLKQLLQVVEALEEAEQLMPEQRERLFRAAGYIDPRRDRGARSSAPPAPSAPSPDLKAFFANRETREAPLERLLRLYGELFRWCQAEGYPVPALDGNRFAGSDQLTEERVDQYLAALREEAERAGKRAR